METILWQNYRFPEERRLLSFRDRALYNKDGFPVPEAEGSQYIGAFVLQAAPRSPDLTVTTDKVIHNDSGHVERNIYTLKASLV